MVELSDNERQIDKPQESKPAQPAAQFDNPLSTVAPRTDVTSGPQDRQTGGLIAFADVYGQEVTNPLTGKREPISEAQGPGGDSERPEDSEPKPPLRTRATSREAQPAAPSDAPAPPGTPAKTEPISDAQRPGDDSKKPEGSEPKPPLATRPSSTEVLPAAPATPGAPVPTDAGTAKGPGRLADIAAPADAIGADGEVKAAPLDAVLPGATKADAPSEDPRFATPKAELKDDPRRTTVKNADGSVTETRLSPDGSRIERHTSADGNSETLRHYTKAGVLDGEQVREYGPDKRLTKTSERLFNSNGTETGRLETNFDRKADGTRVETVKKIDQSGRPTEIVASTYDARGHIKSSLGRQLDEQGQTQSVTESTYKTDPRGRISHSETSKYDKEPGAADRKFLGLTLRDYERDNEGNIKKKTSVEFADAQRTQKLGTQEVEFHTDISGLVCGKEIRELNAQGGLISNTRVDRDGRKVRETIASKNEKGEQVLTLNNFNAEGQVVGRSTTTKHDDGSYSVARQELDANGRVKREHNVEVGADGSLRTTNIMHRENGEPISSSREYPPGTINRLGTDPRNPIESAVKNLTNFGQGDVASGLENVALLGHANLDKGIETLEKISTVWKQDVAVVMDGITELGKQRRDGGFGDAARGIGIIQQLGSKDQQALLSQSFSHISKGVSRFWSDGNIADAAAQFTASLGNLLTAAGRSDGDAVHGANHLMAMGDSHGHREGIRRLRDRAGGGDAQTAVIHYQVDGSGNVDVGLMQHRRFSDDQTWGSAFNSIESQSPTGTYTDGRERIIAVGGASPKGEKTFRRGSDICELAGNGSCSIGANNVRELGAGDLVRGGDLIGVAGHEGNAAPGVDARVEGVRQIAGFSDSGSSFVDGTANLLALQDRLKTTDTAVAIRDAESFHPVGQPNDLITAASYIKNYGDASKRDFKASMLDAGAFTSQTEGFSLARAAVNIDTFARATSQDFGAAMVDASGFTDRTKNEKPSLETAALRLDAYAKGVGMSFPEATIDAAGFAPGERRSLTASADNISNYAERRNLDFNVASVDAAGFVAAGERRSLTAAGGNLTEYSRRTNQTFNDGVVDASGFVAAGEKPGLTTAANHLAVHAERTKLSFADATVDAAGFTGKSEKPSLSTAADHLNTYARNIGQPFDRAMVDASGFTATGEAPSLTRASDHINVYAASNGLTFDSAAKDASGFTARGEQPSLTGAADHLNAYARNSGQPFDKAMVDASGFTARGEQPSLTRAADHINVYAAASGMTFDGAAKDASGFTARGEQPSLTRAAENINTHAANTGRTFDAATTDAASFTGRGEGMSLTASAGHINNYAQASNKDFSTAMKDASGLVAKGESPSLAAAARTIDTYAQSSGRSFDAATTDISRFVKPGQEPGLTAAAQNLQAINPNLNTAINSASRFVNPGEQPSLAAGAANLAKINPDLAAAARQVSAFVAPGEKPNFDKGAANLLGVDRTIGAAVAKLQALSPEGTIAAGMQIAQQSLKASASSSDSNTNIAASKSATSSAAEPPTTKVAAPEGARPTESKEKDSSNKGCPAGCRCAKCVGELPAKGGADGKPSDSKGAEVRPQSNFEGAQLRAQQANDAQAAARALTPSSATDSASRPTLPPVERVATKGDTTNTRADGPAPGNNRVFSDNGANMAALLASPLSLSGRSGRDGITVSLSTSPESRTLAQVSISRNDVDKHMALPGATPVVTVARPVDSPRETAHAPKLPGIEIRGEGMQALIRGANITVGEALRIAGTASAVAAAANLRLSDISAALVPGRFLGTTNNTTTSSNQDGKNGTKATRTVGDFIVRAVGVETVGTASAKLTPAQIRRIKTKGLNLTGAEIALAALIISSAVARQRDKDAEAIAAQIKASGNVNDLARLAADQAEENKDDDSIPTTYANLTRPTWLVRPNEDLLKLAEHLFHERALGWLIADLNIGQIKETEINGKRVIELRVRQRIMLPVWQDIVKFHRQQKPANIENLITIVEQTAVDSELMASSLASAMGVAKPATPSTPAARPILAKESQPAVSKGVTVTAATAVPSAKERAIAVARKAATMMMDAARTFSVNHQDQGPSAGAAVTNEFKPRRQRDLRIEHLLTLTGKL